MTSSNSTLLSALEQARRDGYLHDFHFVEESDLQIIEVIPCLSCRATLYRIIDDDIKGTWVHHWEI